MEESLPNITGYFGGTICLGYQYAGAFGRFGGEGGLYGNLSATSGYTSHYDFDASRSSSIYGSSTTVTPLSESSFFCIKF